MELQSSEKYQKLMMVDHTWSWTVQEYAKKTSDIFHFDLWLPVDWTKSCKAYPYVTLPPNNTSNWVSICEEGKTSMLDHHNIMSSQEMHARIQPGRFFPESFPHVWELFMTWSHNNHHAYAVSIENVP